MIRSLLFMSLLYLGFGEAASSQTLEPNSTATTTNYGWSKDKPKNTQKAVKLKMPMVSKSTKYSKPKPMSFEVYQAQSIKRLEGLKRVNLPAKEISKFKGAVNQKPAVIEVAPKMDKNCLKINGIIQRPQQKALKLKKPDNSPKTNAKF